MAGDNLLHVGDGDFETSVLKSDLPVLVDFWAAWCGPCQAIGPTIEELADEYAGRIKVAKLNVDENQKTPGRYGIRAIPTLMVFKGGQVAEQITGAVGKSQIVQALEKVL
ncbi:MAG: thioredoxin [Thermodesulfobacteriota bacterium]